MWHRLLGILLLFFSTIRSHGDSDVEDRVFLRAQCKARCLHVFSSTTEDEIDTIVDRLGARGDLASECFQLQKNNCSEACFSACDVAPTMCQSQCSIGQMESVGCSLGCLLLSDVSPSRPGNCPAAPSTPAPPPTRAHQCRNQCSDDNSCTQPLHKCCQVGCSRQCSEPTYDDSVPLLAMEIELQPVIEGPGMFRVVWTESIKLFQERYAPLVFILQTRFCACTRFAEEHASRWQTLIMTVHSEATIDTIERGQSYEFRLATVGIHGSRGFGPASLPYPQGPQRPRPPSPPINVMATRWRINSMRKASIQLSWLPPADTDIPIINYSISWARENSYSDDNSNPMTYNDIPVVRTVEADVTEYSIEDLLPGSLYKVGVTAISYWHGEGKLESQPNTIVFSPQQLRSGGRPRPDMGSLPYKSMEPAPKFIEDCKCAGLEKNSDRLSIYSPEIFNGDLTAPLSLEYVPHMDNNLYWIEWFPVVCMDSKENVVHSDAASSLQRPDTEHVMKAKATSGMFRLTNLKFNCVYMVKLTPVQQANRRPPFTLRLKTPSAFLPTEAVSDVLAACFCTQSCQDTRTASGQKRLDCPSSELPPLQPPRNIEVELVNYDRMDYRISWLPPLPPQPMLASPGSQHPFASNVFAQYRLVWGPRTEEPVDVVMYNVKAGFSPIPDLQKSDTRVVNKNQTSLILHNLRPRTVYILLMQTLGSEIREFVRESPPVMKFFVTNDHFASKTPPAADRNHGFGVGGGGKGSTAHLRCSWRLILIISLRTLLLI